MPAEFSNPVIPGLAASNTGVNLPKTFSWSLYVVAAGVTAKGTGPHRAGVNADLTPSTGGPVGHACR